LSMICGGAKLLTVVKKGKPFPRAEKGLSIQLGESRKTLKPIRESEFAGEVTALGAGKGPVRDNLDSGVDLIVMNPSKPLRERVVGGVARKRQHKEDE